MFQPPPLPPWEGLHPLVVHYPIALLTIVPLLVLLAAAWSKHAKPLVLAAWVVLTIGVGGTLLATATGDAAEHAVRGAADGWYPVMKRHENVAESARNMFLGLWALFTVFGIVVMAFGKPVPRSLTIAGCVVYVLLHLPATLVLANAAHLGGRLVHEFGARAPLTRQAAAPAPVHDDED